MNVIFGHAHAAALKQRYTVLELINLKDINRDYQCYCVIEGNQIPPDQLPTLDHYVELHGKLIEAIKTKQKTVILHLAQSLHRRWSGELDSFYEAVINQFQ